MTPSSVLQAWLDQREKHLEVKQRIADAGGHMMLRSESYDPDALDEPLRSEAKAYFDYLRSNQE